MGQAKFLLTDIHKLTELYFSKRYFSFENNLHLFHNSDPIVLSRMGMLSKVIRRNWNLR